MKKTLSMLFALIMVFAVAVSCVNGNKNQGDSTQSDSVAVSSAESEYTAPKLPDLNLDGNEWVIYATNVIDGSFYVEEPENEIVSEALYKTLCKVEDRYDCDIVVDFSGALEEGQQIFIKQNIDAGETRYSMVELHDKIGTNTALEGYFANLYDVPYLTLTTPWWHGVEDFTINKKAFMIDADMSIISLKNTWMIFFNKQIMDERNLEYPYKTVLDGNWTLEALRTLTKDVYSDLNKNNEIDNDDMFGFHCMESMYGWLDSFDTQLYVKNNSGELAITEKTSRVQQIVDAMYDYLKNTTGAQTSGTTNYVNTSGFVNGQYMMFHHVLGQAGDVFRFEEDLDYGILPSPKFDENQSEYLSNVLTYPFWIPSGLHTEQIEAAGAVIEALAYEGYLNTVPAYYERALKSKYNPDDESSKMIEIIHDGMRPSLSWCFSRFEDNILYFTFYNLFCVRHNTDFPAFYDSIIESEMTQLDIVNSFYFK